MSFGGYWGFGMRGAALQASWAAAKRRAATAPAAPTQVVVFPGDEEVTIFVTDGDDGGSAITQHAIYTGPDAGSLTLDSIVAAASRHVLSATNGDPLVVAVASINAVDEGPQSTPFDPVTPAEPGDLGDFTVTVESGANGLVLWYYPRFEDGDATSITEDPDTSNISLTSYGAYCSISLSTALDSGTRSISVKSVRGASEQTVTITFEVEAAYNAVSQAWFDEMSGTLNDTEKGHIDDFIDGLDTDGVLPLLDRLWLNFLDDSTDALRDIIHPTDLATLNGSVTHTPGTGHTGAGGVIDAPVNIDTETHYSQNSASIFFWSLSTGSSFDGDMGIHSSFATVMQSYNGFFCEGNINGGSGVNVGTPSPANGAGFRCISRSGATTGVGCVNATTSSLTLDSSSTLPSQKIELLGAHEVQRSTRTMAAWGYGEHLTALQQVALQGRLSTLLTAFGVSL